MEYVDAAKEPYIRFTATKEWCTDGYRVTWGTMSVKEAWIRSDLKFGPDQDGYAYVPSGLEQTHRFLSYNGHSNGAHQSTLKGRFVYRLHGFSQPAQVFNPFLSRMGRYDGTCVGPQPADYSPRIGAVTPLAGATRVAASANVKASFNTSMDPTTIDGASFYLIRKSTGRQVAATYSYDATTKTAVLNPNNPLAAGATYTASVLAGPFGVKTAKGDPVVSEKTWTFRAAD
jgi:hypothetical protein